MAEKDFSKMDADEVKKIKDALENQVAEKDFNKMDADEVKKIKDALENQDMSSAVATIQNYLTQIDNVQLNIAVTGESGSGKSTFINVFRGLEHEDDGSAPTGVVETTLEPKEYVYPKYPNVRLWDLPGIGTPKFKAGQYLTDVHFERYDFFIIVAADRFRECHVQLASEIQKMRKNFYFLRSKIEINIASEKRSKPKTFNEEKTLKAIRDDCIKELKKINVAAPDVFLISCFELALYDFKRLHETIDKELPEQKRNVLRLALPNITLEIIQKKKEALQADIWKMALLSGVVAAVPAPGLSFCVDRNILLLEIRRYYNAFNLDDPSLQALAERSNVSVGELKAEMKYAPQYMRFDEAGVIQLLNYCALELAEGSVEYIFSLIPFVGSLAAGGMSFATIRYMLTKCLDEMATDAQNVLQRALSTPV